MSRVKAYEPVQGQMYQLLLWDAYNREYDHLDYAEDKTELKYLKKEYALSGYHRIKVEVLPQKYWKKD